MSLIIILICIGLQRYLHFNSYTFQVNWLEPYYQWLSAKVSAVTTGHGVVSLLLLVVPILLIVGIVAALFYHLLGAVGYWLFSLIFLWYLLDARDIQKHSYPNTTPEKLFTICYQKLFALIIWYFVFGPVGLALYVVVRDLQEFLSKKESTDNQQLLTVTNNTLGLLDWVPVRLLGLSFALVGHFGAVFKSWMPKLLTGFKTGQQHIIEWGLAALQLSPPTTPDSPTTVPQEDVVTLLNRSLLVWLVAMALITIGIWIG